MQMQRRPIMSMILAAAGSLALAALVLPVLGKPAARKAPVPKLPVHARPINGPGLHHVAIKVYDFDKTIRFYTRGLGLKKVYNWGKGDSRGALLDAGDGAYVEVWAGGKAPEEGRDAGPIYHFALRVANTDAVFKKAVAAGGKPTVKPHDVTIPGKPPVTVHIAFCEGPDGESIEIFQNRVF